MVATVVVAWAVELRTLVVEEPEELLEMVVEAEVQKLGLVVGLVGVQKQKVAIGMKKAKAGIDHALIDGRVDDLEPAVELQTVVAVEPEELLEMVVEAEVQELEPVIGLVGVQKQKVVVGMKKVKAGIDDELMDGGVDDLEPAVEL